MKVTRSVLVPYHAEEMFDVVNDVSSYPSFVPGCMDATVLESTPETMRATLMMKRAGVSLTLTTNNRLNRPSSIELGLVDGPFRHLSGQWRFEPLGDDGCRVALNLDFAASSLTALVIESTFGRMADEMVDAFIARAEHLYTDEN